jgi:N-acetyl-anhydromuramyl-L-alanine amidase AmpD
MKIVQKYGILRSKRRFVRPHTVVLHHTAGGTVSGAVSALKNRGLAYHYIINKKGTVYEYAPPSRYTAHAYKANRGTIGVSLVGGGKYGPATDLQIDSIIQLCKIIKQDYPTVKSITGHKSIDPRGDRWRSAKIDPRFPGEPANGIDNKIDVKYMTRISKACDLVFRPRSYYVTRGLKRGY